MDEIFLYVHPSSINNNHFYLSKDESHHFLKSLRGSIGDEVWLLDGTGLAFRARVEKIDNLWYEYRKGNLSLDEVRNGIEQSTGGINPPSWE